MSTIRLQSSDGEIFDVDAQVAVKSLRTIKDMLEYCGTEDGSDIPIITLQHVRADILRRVLEYANHHKDDPEPLDDEDCDRRIGDISTWDADFLKLDQGTLFHLISAANYLDAKGLLDVTCQTVANMMKYKTPDEIRRLFNIENDFPPEEQEQRKEDE